MRENFENDGLFSEGLSDEQLFSHSSSCSKSLSEIVIFLTRSPCPRPLKWIHCPTPTPIHRCDASAVHADTGNAFHPVARAVICGRKLSIPSL